MRGNVAHESLAREPDSALTHLFRDAGRPLLIPYAVGGFPDLEDCRAVLKAYREGGADLVEIGVPFSDPLADGPVIQGATQVALRRGVRPKDVFKLAGEVVAEGTKVILLCYLNPILAFGVERFFSACREEGILGVVVPDLPAEEAPEIQATARSRGVDVVLLAAPTSTEVRLERIARAASGFIYCVSTTGVTGVRASLRSDLPQFVGRVRRHTDLPLAVGFGVSTAGQAEEVAQYADGVIIGSALVDLVVKSQDLAEAVTQIKQRLYEVRRMPSFSK